MYVYMWLDIQINTRSNVNEFVQLRFQLWMGRLPVADHRPVDTIKQNVFLLNMCVCRPTQNTHCSKAQQAAEELRIACLFLYIWLYIYIYMRM